MAYPRLHIASGNLLRAQVNAGTLVVPADVSRMYRVVDIVLIARGGNCNATSVIVRTGHATPVVIWTCNAANLTTDAVMRPSLASGGTHAIGAGFNADLKTGAGIKIITNGTESSAVSYDYAIYYTIASP